jgi:hypothetical protein
MHDDFDPNRLTLLPSGYFGESSDLIYTVENLVSKEEIDELLYAAKKLDIWAESENRNKYSNMHELKKQCPETLLLLDEICERWRLHIAKFYDVEIKTYANNMSKWPIGGKQKPHADKEWEDGSPGEQNYYDIGSVIYLSDDHEGGEIYFPEFNIELKPKPGTAICFPGDLFFMHGVREVKKTERYTIPIFWTVLKYEKEKDRTLDER